MAKIRVSIETVEQPKPISREERLIAQRDSLMEKMEHAYDYVQAGFNSEKALACIRQCWKWLEKQDACPEHLHQVKEYIRPIIREHGADSSPIPKTKEKKDA